ncbi:E3 ubiquitin-protein ligase ARK2C-like isoform X2 [Bolinopsis microptera]|uniref:E3 ubiquitin-protein ligase ARK2C-like isoform X2 n=1 Tax=Bolinopsis microptera TaxID=2820187 RepID=UPI00307AB32C
MSSLNRDKIPSSDSALIDISGGSNIGDVNQSVTELTSTELEQLCHSSDSASSSNLIPSFLSLGQCMFPSASESQVTVDDNNEIQFLRETEFSGTPGPGRTSNDPIVISDSPSGDDESASSSNMEAQTDGQSMLHVDVVGSQYSGNPYMPHTHSLLHSPEPNTQQTSLSHVYTLRHLPPQGNFPFPHLSYQIRLSIPQPMTVVRPTPVYRPINLHPPSSGPLLHWSSPLEADGFLDSNTGATQRLIEDCTTKTRFIKRMPSKNKALNAKRQTPKCPICLEEFLDKVKIRRLRCIHNFHIKCIDQWLKKNMICPVCRKSILAI